MLCWHPETPHVKLPRTNSAPSALIRNLVLYNRPRPGKLVEGVVGGFHHGFTKGGGIKGYVYMEFFITYRTPSCRWSLKDFLCVFCWIETHPNLGETKIYAPIRRDHFCSLLGVSKPPTTTGCFSGTGHFSPVPVREEGWMKDETRKMWRRKISMIVWCCLFSE